MQRKIWSVVIGIILTVVGIAPKDTWGQEKKIPDFYRGVIIKFVVPYGAGGSRDLWARKLAPFLEKYTGATVVVENMAGGSALRGIEYLYSNAKPDGLTIMIAGMAGVMLANVLELPDAAKSSVEKLNYLGRLDISDRAVFATRASGFKSITDMQKSAKPILFTSTGGTADSAVDATLVSEGFGLNAHIVAGSKGAAEDLILLAEGKANAKASTFSADYREMVKKGDLNLIAFLGKQRNKDYPLVPTALESPGIKPAGRNYLELSTNLAEVGQMIITSPGVDEEKVLFLEKALFASLQEPALLEWAKKDDVVLSYLSGKGCKELVIKMQSLVPKSEREELKRIVFKKYY